jgi:Spermidine synthase
MFAATLILSAVLIFQIQLIFSRCVLPWLGGAASVWITCSLVFQFLLLAGYLYSHFLTSYCSATVQARVHIGLLATTMLFMLVMSFVSGSAIIPNTPGGIVDPADPAMQLILVLLSSVGLPFFVLTSTSPLLQSWLARFGTGQKTYRMFAISNLGSLLGLLTYPFLIEPFLSIKTQAGVWSSAFLVFAAMLMWATLRARKVTSEPIADLRKIESETVPSVQARQWAYWAMLAALGSAMMLASTNILCQEITSLPIVWVLPLSIYLLMFILAFDHPRWYRRSLVYPLYAAALIFTAYTLAAHDYRTEIFVVPIALFFVCMICHGDLARSRPDAQSLTSFYIAVSVGGAAGSLFVAVVAPLVFTSYVELPICLAASGLLFLTQASRSTNSWLRCGEFWPIALAATLSCMMVLVAHSYGSRLEEKPSVILYYIALCICSVAGAAWLLGRKRQQTSKLQTIALQISAFIMLCAFTWNLHESLKPAPGILYSKRNFYGAIRVSRNPQGVLVLEHGQTTHGLQLPVPDDRVPTAYYGPKSTIGIVLTNHPNRAAGQPLRVGIVGLGAGTLAAYGLPGDEFRFFEINPDIISAASGKDAPFSYIRSSKAKVSIVSGDARLSLARELRNGSVGKYDVLILDAFSGDAIPVHLLTEEAFRIYFDALAPDGIIAVHMSSRHVNLEPVLHAVVDEFPVEGRSTFTIERFPFKSNLWMLFSAKHDMLTIEGLDEIGQVEPSDTPPVHWTDDRTSLLSLLRP